MTISEIQQLSQVEVNEFIGKKIHQKGGFINFYDPRNNESLLFSLLDDISHFKIEKEEDHFLITMQGYNVGEIQNQPQIQFRGEFKDIICRCWLARSFQRELFKYENKEGE